MHFGPTEEQEQLRQGARRFLAERGGIGPARKLLDADTGWDREGWRFAARQLGWSALIVPEAYGGAGLGWLELAVVMEEVGRVLAPTPLFATVCLGESALIAAGSDEQRRTWLPPLAAGEITATLACTGGAGRWHTGADAVVAHEGRLSGTHRFVPDGHTADLLVVAAAAPDGVGLYLVPGDAPGLSRRRLITLDRTRPLAEIELDGVPAQRLGGGDASCLQRILDLAAIALAAEQLGGAERCLEMAVEYAETRVQFGRPIGSFQAIKHRCADLFVLVESARSAACWAAWSAATFAAELPLAAATAKAWCSDAFFRCAAESLQIHGGIGFTWEHDAHLYLRRARAAQTLLGDATFHCGRLAEHILGASGGPALY